MPNEKVMKVLDISKMDNNLAPYITEEMFKYIGKSFKVEYHGNYENPENGEVIPYYYLKNNKYFWRPEWLSELNVSYAYEDLMRLDL